MLRAMDGDEGDLQVTVSEELIKCVVYKEEGDGRTVEET